MRCFFLSLFILGGWGCHSFAQVIRIPTERATIQSGIEAAGDGDTVLIEEGIYFENINFLGKSITVASRFLLDGDTTHISKTIIDGSHAGNPDTASVVTMWTGEDTTSILCGLTITGGSGTFVDSIRGPLVPSYIDSCFVAGGGILIYNSGGKIIHNIIEGNFINRRLNLRGGLGCGILAAVNHNHTVVIRNNIIRDNLIEQKHSWGTGIGIHGGRVIVEHNTIIDNRSSVLGMAMGGGISFVYEGVEGTIGEAIIRNNIISQNILYTKYDVGGGGGIGFANTYEFGKVEVNANLISGNKADIGGGVYGYNSMANLVGNIFYKNEAEMMGDDFGTEEENNITMTHNLIWTNDYWIATCQGIEKFRVGESGIRGFDPVNGIRIEPYSSLFSINGSSGEIYIGRRDGMISFNPANVALNMFIYPKVFLDFSSYESRESNENSRKSSRSEVSQLRLDLPFDQYEIVFNSLTLDIENLPNDLYRHYMKERDPDTIESYRFMFANHANLKVRKYHFWASKQDALGMTDPVEMNIVLRIHAPWYRTWWAIVSYIVFLTLLVTVLVRIRTARLKREKVALEREVEKRTAELRQKNEHIMEMERLKTRFFTDISHEIRTPLSLITGPLDQLVRQDHPEPRTREWLTIILRNSQRLLQLVNQLLDISRLDAGHMKLVLEQSDLTRYLRVLTSQYTSLAESKHIRFVVDIPDRELVIWHDREKITKITHNLLSNAFKFTPEGGVVTCRVRIRNEVANSGFPELRLIIADTGSGIPMEEREKIFSRFYRSRHATVEDVGGTGIGLAVTRELAHLMHGEVTVKSLEGKGSIFIASFPLGKDHFKEEEYILKEPEPVEEEEMLEPLAFVEKAVMKSGIEQYWEVLIVEDNGDLRRFIRENLSQEFKVTEAVDGENGLNLALTGIPDLVITDVMMPGMSGMELCEKLKSDERTSHIPVIMLTAKSTREDRKEGLELGADDYIVKPFEMEELLIRIRNLLEQRERLRKKYAGMIGLDWGTMKVTTLDEHFLKKLTGYIAEHIDDFELNVNRLKEVVAMSREHLFRKLKALTGESPSDLIRTMRMKAASAMLEKGEESITRIALNTGFSNPSHFAQTFRKYFGKSPQEYSREYRQKKDRT